MGDCPICKKALLPGDDIVICPDCGAPYHRECYTQKGHCLFEVRHAEGYEYKPATPAGTAAAGNAAFQNANVDTGGGKKGVVCKNCNTINDINNIFCEKCGNMLHGSAESKAGGTGAGYYGPGSQPGRQGGFSGKIQGIPVQDWAEYIGASSPVYLQRFAQMERTGRKASFTLSAFFMSPAYFAYRKMWGWAVLALVFTLLSLTPEFLWIAADAGVNLLPFLSLETLSTISYVTSYISLAGRFVFAIFAFFLYRNNAAKHINALRSGSSSDEDYHTALVKKGGVSVLGVVAVIALIFLFMFGFIALTGDALVSYYYPFY